MNIARVLIRRASCVLAVLALGFGASMAWGQAEVANAASIKFTVLHSFNGTDGGSPTGLVQATNGYIYGTTVYGGGGAYCSSVSCGTIFKISPTGTLTTLYNFCTDSACIDGESPLAGLVQATNGDLYGTTSQGGSNNLCGFGCGTVFKISPSGTLTTLYNFCAQIGCADGEFPMAGLVQAANGDPYGTTYNGGASGRGTVFKISPSGTLTTLYSFCAQSPCTDGQNPYAGLVQATNGDLYGTTSAGGGNGGGTIFKTTPSGALMTLYSFCAQSGCADGGLPFAGLVQATNGDLYGTTYSGGASNLGTVFKISLSGTLTTLYGFCAQSGCKDGEHPGGGLVQASDGDLYGTTSGSVANGNYGTVFKISPRGTLTTLYSFCSQSGCGDGTYPNGLVQATDGIFYGTTAEGGASIDGTVFALYTGAPPFVETRPTIGIVGETVTILGYGLKGATSVTFNGTPATILHDAPTLIYAKVPTGATTGKVQVVTPKGTLTSNVAFEVAP
jgi:uncharacterized repeat protein (TIGR03803 family)